MTGKKNNNTLPKILVIAVIVILIVIIGTNVFGLATKTTPTNTNTVTNTTTNVNAVKDDGTYTAHEWSQSSAPNGYEVRGEAIINYQVNPGEFHYSDIDSLGRTGTAYAAITKADYDRELEEDRASISGINNISGWKGNNAKVEITWPNGSTYKEYMYNRSHLIADSLGGEPAQKNLITGTRFQNCGYDNNGGMCYTETEARDWLAKASTSDYLYYAVTPVYEGNELVPRSVYVDVLTSDGSINQHVEVYNVTGDVSGAVTIDYATGKILKNGSAVK